jgi:hypothetical protein
MQVERGTSTATRAHLVSLLQGRRATTGTYQTASAPDCFGGLVSVRRGKGRKYGSVKYTLKVSM